MFKSLDIQEHMEVVGSDGKHVGTVDHKEGGDRLMLTKDDPKAGGHHHLISIDWVDYVDRKVHLNKPSQKATVEWQPGSGRALPFSRRQLHERRIAGENGHADRKTRQELHRETRQWFQLANLAR